MLNPNIHLQKTKSGNCGDCELCTQTFDNRRVRIQSSEIDAIESIIDSHIMIEKKDIVYGVFPEYYIKLNVS